MLKCTGRLMTSAKNPGDLHGLAAKIANKHFEHFLCALPLSLRDFHYEMCMKFG